MSVIYWTFYYVIDSNGVLIPIPLIFLSFLWFGKKFKRYEIKKNENDEYYIIDNIFKYKKDLENSLWCELDDSDCYTKDLELITKIYNRIIE